MELFAGKATLCSSAITNGGAPMCTAWLDEFVYERSGCTINCVAFHIYDSATGVGCFPGYVDRTMTKYGEPLWMTEVRHSLFCV